MIQELTLRGLLSFGPDSPPLEMRSLNILIGPNGSGKSNLLEALALLQSAPTKLAAPIRGKGGGGVTEWIWKGVPSGHAHVEAVVANPAGQQSLRHIVEFAATSARFELTDEVIEYAAPFPGYPDAYWFYRFQNGRAVLRVKDESDPSARTLSLRLEDLAIDESVLSQRKDPDQYPALAHLANVYGKFKLYKEWSFGRESPLRAPQPADTPGDTLEENYSNLGLFLNHLEDAPGTKREIMKHLQDLYAGITDYRIRLISGNVELILMEGGFSIPASRLSDGTMRYLCLLAILCDPAPPPLVCVEEPELGLHPDMLPKIADLLIAASERTQLVVTTHSDILIDAMTERPESVVVVEKHDGRTQLRRLQADDELKAWLGKYRLGELWTRGEIGGTRW